MDIQKIKEVVENVEMELNIILNEVDPPYTIVRAGDNLQAALDKGGRIELEASAHFEGTYLFKVPGTRFDGSKGSIHGGTLGPAIKVPVGANDIQISLGEATTLWNQAVVEVGENTSKQTRIDQAPSEIVLSVNVPTFRGKHTFAIHGRNVSLIDCNVVDAWDLNAQDSQAIYIGNAPGPVHILRGIFEAGSENILVGGDSLKIPGLVPANLLFEDLTLMKRASWQTDGMKRAIKNLFELKAGVNVILKNSKLSGSWADGQVGFAIVITPKYGTLVGNVLLENLVIRDVAQGINLIGYDYDDYSPQVNGVTVSKVDAVCSKALYGGDGRFALWAAEPLNFHIQDCNIVADGSSTLYFYQGDIKLPDGTKRTGGQCRGFKFIRNTSTFRKYGLGTPAGLYAQNWKTWLPDGVIEGNILSQVDSQTKPNLPGNTFV